MAHSQSWYVHDTPATPPVTNTGGAVTASDTLRQAAAEVLEALIYLGLYILSTSEGMLSR